MASKRITDFDNSSFVSNGIQVTNIHFIYSLEDMDDPKKVFKPIFCHQVYNANENIFGYRNLKVNIFYNGFTWDTYLQLNYKKKIQENTTYNIKADDISKMLKNWMPKQMITDEGRFLNTLEDQNGKLHGDIVDCFKHVIFKTQNTKFTITWIKNSNEEFKVLHDKFERLLVWFIDAVNLIDFDDPRWMHFYIYEHKNDKVYPIGFCTTYLFFNYPDKSRVRISQFFILPTHQRMGLGTKLLQALYKQFQNDDTIYDITVEDPSDNFRILRDIVDCNFLKTLPEFSKINVLEKPFNKVALESARKHFKIFSAQARRVYEILNLFYAGKNDDYLVEWFKRILSRLHAKWIKKNGPSRKKKRIGVIGEMVKTNLSAETKTNMKRIETFFEEIVPIIQKLQTVTGEEEVVKNFSELKNIYEKLSI